MLLFGLEKPQSSSHKPWIMTSTSINQVTQCIQNKNELLKQHNAFEISRQYTCNSIHHLFAEILNQDVTAASLGEERAVQRYRDAIYSIELLSAHAPKNVLRQKLSILLMCFQQARNGIDQIKIISQDLSVPFEFAIPTTYASDKTTRN